MGMSCFRISRPIDDVVCVDVRFVGYPGLETDFLSLGAWLVVF